MRVVFLADARSVHIERWISFFNRQGDETYLISLEKSESQVTKTIQIEPKVAWDFAKYWLATGEVKRMIERIKPDVVNTHFVPNYGLLGARLGFKPVVVSVWGSDILISAGKSLLHRRRASWVLKKADWLTSDSVYLTEEMVKLGADKGKISTFPMGVESDIFPPAPRNLSSKDVITVISTRRLEPIYNLDLLIKAIPLVLEQTDKKVNFVVVGEGSQKERLQEKVREQGLGDKVEFKGTLGRPELVSLLHSSDIYVSTSLSDSTSVSLLEGFACGLVPIVTDIPGNREWIKDRENGFLFPPGRPELLAEKISSVCLDLPRWKAMVDRNQRLIREKADYQSNLTRLREKFETLAGIARSGKYA